MSDFLTLPSLEPCCYFSTAKFTSVKDYGLDTYLLLMFAPKLRVKSTHLLQYKLFKIFVSSGNLVAVANVIFNFKTF